MSLQVMIVEDEPIIAKELEYYVSKLGHNVVAKVYEANEVLEKFNEVLPSLILMDINLGVGESGIELASKIKIIKDVPIIFITSYSDKETVDRVLAVKPDGYITKPFHENELFFSIETAQMKHAENAMQAPNNLAKDFVQQKDIFVKHKNSLVKVGIQNILYAEAENNYTYIYTTTEKYLLCNTLGIIEEKLQGLNFMRVHRSYLVNLQHISSITEDIISIGSKSIPISRQHKKELMDKIQTL